MKKVKVICKALVFFVIGILGPLKVFNYLLVDDTNSYTRVMIHEMYNQPENIDVLFLGSSHCYRTLDPKILDEVWGVNTFNCGTSSQHLDGAYALLKEVTKDNQPETVYLEMFYTAMGEVYQDRTQMTSTYIISDYLKPSFNKYSYILNASSKEYYIDSFFLARRNWKKIFQNGYVNSVIERKQLERYKAYQYVDNGNERYEGKGYVANYTSVENGVFILSEHFGPVRDNRLSEDDIKYVKKIKDLCDNKGINLVLFSAPMSDFRLCDVGNYDNYIDQMRRLAAEIGVEYYDFNLCRENTLSLSAEDFYDDQHLNKSGADRFSYFFADFFKAEERKSVFYESYKEKMENMKEEILGAIIWKDKEAAVLNFDIVAPCDLNLHYTLEVCTEDASDTYEGTGMNAQIPLDIGESAEITVNFLDVYDTVLFTTNYQYN